LLLLLFAAYHLIIGYCGQVGAFAEQLGTRVSETKVSMEPTVLCSYLFEGRCNMNVFAALPFCVQPPRNMVCRTLCSCVVGIFL